MAGTYFAAGCRRRRRLAAYVDFGDCRRRPRRRPRWAVGWGRGACPPWAAAAWASAAGTRGAARTGRSRGPRAAASPRGAAVAARGAADPAPHCCPPASRTCRSRDDPSCSQKHKKMGTTINHDFSKYILIRIICI